MGKKAVYHGNKNLYFGYIFSINRLFKPYKNSITTWS